MILQDAYIVAQKYLDLTVRTRGHDEIVICSCEEFPDAWVFGYNTRLFLEHLELVNSLIGNGPVVVPKSGESAFLGGSGTPIEEQLAERWPQADGSA